MPSSFVTPQQDAFRNFLRFPSDITDPLRPCIIGPRAKLIRYGVAAEKGNGLLGAYDPINQHTFPYPNRDPGSLVDQSYTKLFIDSALLKYWDKQSGVNGTVTPVTGQPNQIRAANFIFQSNTNYPRNVAFGDRDVQVGDVVDVTGVVGGTNYTKRSSIIGFASDPVFATVSPAAADANNPPTQAAGTTATKTAGANNQIGITASSAANYYGEVTGDLKETYTIQVVQGSTAGDLRTARLRITSASGNDNYYPTNADGTQGVIPAIDGFAFNLTPRGASVTFGIVAGAPVDAGVPAQDLVAGQTWTLQVTQAWTAVAPTSGGSYRGQQDTTYIVTVLTGGLYGGAGAQGAQGAQGAPGGVLPTIMITTTNGVDSSGPVTIHAANTAVPIGTQGVTIMFSGNGLSKNSRFTVPVTGQKSGPQQTLILQDNLPDQLTSATPAPDLSVKLSIRKNAQITGPRYGSAPQLNWGGDPDNITVYPGITALDPTYTVNGVQTALPVTEGQLYVELRQWVQTDAGSVDTLSTVDDINNKLGIIHPDNPLAWGVNLAMLNASGSVIAYGILAGDPAVQQSWYNFIAGIDNLGGIYNLAPLTFDGAVLKAFADHVNAQSAPEVGAYRSLWCSLQSQSTRSVITAATTTDKAVALATVTADPATGLNTMLKVPAGNAKFITNPNVNPLEWPQTQTGSSTTKPAVQAGDIVRYQFTSDGFGTPQWTEYRVLTVANDDTLILATPLPAPFTVAQQVEIWHPMSKDDIANDLLVRTQPLKSRLVRVVWPDSADGNPGYFVAAALAGQASGVIVNQGLKNLQLVGFTDMSRATKYLSAGALLKMAQNGIWIVSQDSLGSTYTKSAVNTDVSTLEKQEEVIVRNADAVSLYIVNGIQKFVGTSNVVTGTERAVRGAIQSAVNYLKGTNVADNLGPPLLDATILELRKHQVLKDRIVCTIRLTLQYPLNKVQLQVQIVS